MIYICLLKTPKMPFTIASKTMKYLKINLTKEMKDLCTETEENTSKWKDIPYSWINIVKISILPKDVYRFNVSLSKFQWHFSHK